MTSGSPAKTFILEGTKCVCTGSRHQMEHLQLHRPANNPSYLMKISRDNNLTPASPLKEGECSEFAMLASELL